MDRGVPGANFEQSCHPSLDLLLINAHVCTDLAWSQSCRGLNHLDEKSATLPCAQPLGTRSGKRAEWALYVHVDNFRFARYPSTIHIPRGCKVQPFGTACFWPPELGWVRMNYVGPLARPGKAVDATLCEGSVPVQVVPGGGGVHYDFNLLHGCNPGTLRSI